MSVKLTLDDGTEWTVLEKIQYRINDKEWVDRIIRINPYRLDEVSLQAIANNPGLFRKIHAPVETPLTDADVLEMLREGGIEFKYYTDNLWVSGNDYSILQGGVSIRGEKLSAYTHYRRRSENWVERKMVKVV